VRRSSFSAARVEACGLLREISMSKNERDLRSPHRIVEERIAAIKASIAARTAELAERIQRVRNVADARALIARHPWATVGIGLAAGLLVGQSFAPRRLTSGGAEPHRGVLGATLRALAVTLATNYARHLGERWMIERSERAHPHGVAPERAVPTHDREHLS
jgi:ElaB/YqjD/DUF883 family membrane-anchored ribosome-binding protein